MKPLTEVYFDWIASTIDEKGFDIPHALASTNGDITVYALALPITEAYRLMLTEWAAKKPDEIIFAFDRFAKEGQGTQLGDLMAGHHFVGEHRRPFIIEYQYDPRIVKPIRWDNAWWNRALTDELYRVVRSMVAAA